MDGRTDRQTDTQNFGGYNIIPNHFFVAGHKTIQIMVLWKLTSIFYVTFWSKAET